MTILRSCQMEYLKKIFVNPYNYSYLFNNSGGKHILQKRKTKPRSLFKEDIYTNTHKPTKKVMESLQLSRKFGAFFFFLLSKS